MSEAVESLGESSVEQALESAFNGDPVKNVAVEEAQEEQVDEQALEAEAEAAPEVEEEPALEPSFEIEVDGQKELVTGQERIRELLQKGMHYGRNSEINARAREQLIAQAKQQELTLKFQQETFTDIAELRALDQQLEQWNKVDLAAEFEKDMFGAMRMKETRDQLRERRNAKQQQLDQKVQSFSQSQLLAAQQAEQAETNVLLAKLPEWRNSEKAQAEKEQIKAFLQGHGYTTQEINSVLDHRFVLLARDALKYRQLQQNKNEKLKQVRTAPPVVKPGAKEPRNDKAEFVKFKQQLRRAGQQGNHRAQEDALVKVLGRAFG